MPDGRRLDQQFPGRFPFALAACPIRCLREMDAELRPLLRVVRDHRAGVLDGWPESYTASAVDAVHYVLENSDGAAEHVAGLT